MGQLGVGISGAVNEKLRAGVKASIGGVVGDGPHGGRGALIQIGSEFGVEVFKDLTLLVGAGGMQYFRGNSGLTVEGGIRYAFSMPWTPAWADGTHGVSGNRRSRKGGLRKSPIDRSSGTWE